MKSNFLIILSCIFLIGNFHVATDWCDDLSNDESQRAFQVQSQPQTPHDPATDLCGHCGHTGLNVLVINTTYVFSPLVILSNKPEVANHFQVSVFLPPPTPPPIIFS